MTTHRPTTTDRNIANYIMRLPIGTKATINVAADDDKAFLKPEGSLIIQQGGKRVVIAPVFHHRPWFHTEWGSVQYNAHIRDYYLWSNNPHAQ